uniref:Uncharacterized protein n=1 Tax=Myoviridae sp. ctIty1 TaxID=2827673 RepID=A0A8S5THI8_9CAUD|nr:MAG TPA: hypothetical protein [Myoviridae sp. ctIty1]
MFLYIFQVSDGRPPSIYTNLSPFSNILGGKTNG